MVDSSEHVLIIGAGPAGLSAGYLLAKAGVQVTVLEADPQYVGGISRTANYKGYFFDIGGHRFFSKSKEVEELWTEILPHDMLQRPRLSSIYYRGRFFTYPLKAAEALTKLGLLESTRCVLSYLKAKLFPVAHPKSFEDWVSNQFGDRLYRIFFKTYTEKVWGIDCRSISADWAAQRIRGLSLGSAIRTALFPQRGIKDRSRVIKTLIDTFRYPRRGPGMMWEVCAEKIRALGGAVLLDHAVTGCDYREASGQWTVTCKRSSGEQLQFQGSSLISSAPLRELVNSLSPPVPPEVVQAANALRYRDFIVVALIVKGASNFPDNWIYIHDPAVSVGRIQNFQAWSPEMVPDAHHCCYGLEYFCFEGDGFWNSSDAELIELAKRELSHVGLAKVEEIVDGCVVRQHKAYPVYDEHYAMHVERVKQELSESLPTLHLVGRNGMHKYNNQDHAMMTAMLTVKNILAGKRIYDVWQVNQDAEYHETITSAERSSVSGERLVPRTLPKLDN